MQFLMSLLTTKIGVFVWNIMNLKLDKKKYDVLIDSKIFSGKMNYSEMTIRGKTKLFL